MLSRGNVSVGKTLCLCLIYYLSREDAYSRMPGFSYSYFPLGRQEFVPPYYGLQMMAPQSSHFVQSAVQSSSDLPAPPVSTQESVAQKKKHRWSDTEERILIELFGENEDRLRYKAYSSPEWQSIARLLHEKCQRENVACDKTAQQCKNKMANLTKKYKSAKDKLRSTGYGRGGDGGSDHETGEIKEESELVPRHFNDMDEILGNREAVNPRHVLESSTWFTHSSPEVDRDDLEKEALDEEIFTASRVQNRRHENPSGPSGECDDLDDLTDESGSDESLAFSKALFFKPKGKNKKSRTSTPKKQKKRGAGAGEKTAASKSSKKKVKGTPGADEPTVLSFLERSQERDEAFMERMANADREYRREQQKFSMDALSMLGNILKDVVKGNE